MAWRECLAGERCERSRPVGIYITSALGRGVVFLGHIFLWWRRECLNWLVWVEHNIEDECVFLGHIDKLQRLWWAILHNDVIVRVQRDLEGRLFYCAC